MDQVRIMEIESTGTETENVPVRQFADELPRSRNESNKNKEPILISSFAHKGGVGKTTGVQNIGCMLAKEFGLRVLIVDADPQCSITGALMRKYFVEEGRRERAERENQENNEEDCQESSTESEQESNQESSERKKLETKEAEDDMDADLGEEKFYDRPADEIVTIYRCFAPPGDITFSRFVNEANIKERIKDVKLQHLEDYGDLFFLPGDLELNEFEDELFTAFTHGKQENTNFPYADYPGLFCKAFREIAKERQIDVVLLDLSPGTTVLNRCLVMGSDYFLISSLPDFYSRRAIHTVSKVINRWDKSIDYFRNAQHTTPMFAMPPGPKFLGHLFNRVKLLKGRPPGDKEMKMRLIETSIDQNLLKLENIVHNTFRQYISPTIKEFDRAADRGIEKGVPMAYLPIEDIMHTKLEKNKFERQQTYYLGAYYTAIMTIFSNLSEEHHHRLGNRFLPQKTFENEPDGLILSPYKAHTLDEKKDLQLTEERNTSQAWVALKSDYANHLHSNYKNEAYGFSLNRDIQDNMALFPISAIRKEYEDEKKLVEECQEELQKRLETFGGAFHGLTRGRGQLTDLDKLVLISQLSAPRKTRDDQDAIKYISQHREMTQRFIQLQNFLKSDHVVAEFINILLTNREASLSSYQFDLIFESMPKDPKIVLCMWDHPLPKDNETAHQNVALRLLRKKPEVKNIQTYKDYIMVNLLKLANKKLKLLKKGVEKNVNGKIEKKIKPSPTSH